MKTLLIVAAVVVAVLASGCASIVSGSTQSLSVESQQKGQNIAGATCKLTNDKGTWYVNTPGTVSVHRSYDDLNVRCEKAQIDPGVVVAKSSTKAMMFGNIIFGGPIGAAVDAGTGAGYDYPSIITVEMGTTITMDVPKPDGQDAPGTATSVKVKNDVPTGAESQAPSNATTKPFSGVVPVSDTGSRPTVTSTVAEPPQADQASRLKKLKDLRDAGLITDADYEKKKAEILNGM